MNIITRKTLVVLFASLPSLSAIDAARSDELSELYLNSSSTTSSSAIPPNILFIIDTSSSMDADPGFWMDPEDYWGPYDPNVDYPGECGAAEDEFIYWDKVSANDSTEDFPDPTLDCTSTTRRFRKSSFVCDSSNVLTVGKDTLTLQEYRPYAENTSGNKINIDGSSSYDMDGEWHIISTRTGEYAELADLRGPYNWDESTPSYMWWRECLEDYGVHGANDDPSTTTTNESTAEPYPDEDRTSISGVAGYQAGLSGAVSTTESDWREYYVWTANYLNYHNWAQTRLAAVQAAIKEVVNSLPADVKIGLMRFDADTGTGDGTDGGMMAIEFMRAGTGSNRQDFINRLYSIMPWEGTGTPLAETLFEATMVFRGDLVTYGNSSNHFDENGGTVDKPSTPASRKSSDPMSPDYLYYASPIEFQCQDNSIVYLSDGAPSSDSSAWSGPGVHATDGIKDLPGISSYATSSCGEECMVPLAEYLAEVDQSPLPGMQTVTVNTVGFGDGLSETDEAYLQETASVGQGIYTMANSFEALKSAFQIVVRNAIAENASLSSPAVTVNAFNRLSHQDDLYFTMFDPILDSVHWPGNVKKYKLKKMPDGEFRIVDSRGIPALATDSSELVFDALSYWSDTTDPWVAANGGADGNKTAIGGAAGELTDSTLATRKIYSWFGSSASLTHSSNAFTTSNANITNDLVGLDSGATNLGDVINFMRGVDVRDDDGDGSTSDARRVMGAAPHGVPAIITYGTDAASSSQVIYAPTNDGFLHAIDAATGQELWAFVPTEAMAHFADMFTPPTPTYIAYGLDAPVIAHELENAGVQQKVIYFGMRRGGRALYALDVTDKHNPIVLWRKRGGVDTGFEELAQTWSDVAPAMIKIDGTKTPVLIFGGGYDAASQDSAAADSNYVADTTGRAVFIVHAKTGALLWRAGPASGADLVVADMKSSIAAEIEIKDKNDDGLADIFYAVDLGGRIFRFDINNDANSASGLSITGGKIASLGAGDLGAAGNITNNRKFFNKPDVVLMAKGSTPYWAINIGSGDRERPKSNMTDDSTGTYGTINYLFSVKDTHVFTAPGDYDYGIGINDLYDATDNDIQNSDPAVRTAAMNALQAADGWKVELENNGEKSLSEAKTFDFRVYFTTFDPTPLDATNCNTLPGRARLYSLDLATAGAPEDVDEDGLITKDDRTEDLTHGTVPPAVTFIFLENDDGTVEATNIIGRSDKKARFGNANAVRKTYWYINSDDAAEQ